LESSVSSADESRRLVVVGIIFEGGLVFVAIVLAWILGLPQPAQYISLDAMAIGWGIIASVPMLLMMLLMVHTRLAVFANALRVIEEQILPVVRRWTIWEMAILSILAGIGEELLIRGVVQVALGGQDESWVGITTGVLGSGFVFGLLHLLNVTYAMIAAAYGVYLGSVWLVSDNLLVPILAHAVYDFFAMLYLGRIHKPPAAMGTGLTAEQCSHPNEPPNT